MAWNHNRALWCLRERFRCDVVVLIEDDAVVTADGWDAVWAEAAMIHGYVGCRMSAPVRGSGTPADPFIAPGHTTLCCAVRGDLLDRAGYWDTTYQPFGGHLDTDWRWRLAAVAGNLEGGPWGVSPCLDFGVEPVSAGTTMKPRQTDANGRHLQERAGHTGYVPPWAGPAAEAEFRREQGD